MSDSCPAIDRSSPGSPILGFSRQERWSGLPFSSPGDTPHPGIELTSLASPTLQAESLPLSHHMTEVT